mgnify:FL=1
MKTVVIGGGPACILSVIKASNIRRQCYTIGKNGVIRQKIIDNRKRQM